MVKLTTLENKPQIEFTEEKESRNFDKLKGKYGHRKNLPRGYELATLLALSYFPELGPVAIDFVFKPGDLTLSARPKVSSLLFAARQRKYLVNISKKAKSSKQPVMLKNLDFNTQVGVIGHELAHISCYLKSSSIEILRDTFMYNFSSYKRMMERKTDKLAIKRGLGYQLLSYADLVSDLKKKFPQEEYYNSYTRFYLSAGEIKAKIQKLKIYQNI